MKRRRFLGKLVALFGASILPAARRVPTAPDYLQLHPGAPPPGAVDASFLQNVTGEDGGWEPDSPTGLMEVVAWGTGRGQTVLLAAKPPRPGQSWLRWNSGLRDAEGWSAIGGHGGPTMPYGPLEASGSSIGTHGQPRVGVVSGIVTKRAARLRVYFRTGRPLELVPVDAGDRFPVNFYAGRIGNPNMASGGMDGLSSGWSPMTRPAAGSPSISRGAADGAADPPHRGAPNGWLRAHHFVASGVCQVGKRQVGMAIAPNSLARRW
jgi:hypothetical protein